jgi:hypothetical protein
MPTDDLSTNPFTDMWETPEEKQDRLLREQKLRSLLKELETIDTVKQAQEGQEGA